MSDEEDKPSGSDDSVRLPVTDGVVRLLPSVQRTYDNRAASRQILLRALQQLEDGEFEYLVLLTVQKNGDCQARWHTPDPIRAIGALESAKQLFLSRLSIKSIDEP